MYMKIAFITACMGRLSHLKLTLEKNIKDNSDYLNCKFYLLDYNSKDGLEEWVLNNMQKYIDTNKLVYLKNKDAKFFRFAHSRNQLIKSVDDDTDVIVNLDADNYTGFGFAKYISNTFKVNRFMVGCIYNGKTFDPVGYSDTLLGTYGRIVVSKNSLLKINGYDEAFKDWGFDDSDLYLRLLRNGLNYETISLNFLHSIPHTDEERAKNTECNNVAKIKDNFDCYTDIMYAYTKNNPIKRNLFGWGEGVLQRNFNELIKL